jgi:hypothetical protein
MDKVLALVARISFAIVAWKIESKRHSGDFEGKLKLLPLALLWFFLDMGLHFLWENGIRPMLHRH